MGEKEKKGKKGKSEEKKGIVVQKRENTLFFSFLV